MMAWAGDGERKRERREREGSGNNGTLVVGADKGKKRMEGIVLSFRSLA